MLHKRNALALLLGTAGASLAPRIARADDGPVVETDAGRVQGAELSGVSVFKGIPYGASTAGKNRFLPPQPVTPWTGIRGALEFGDASPQVPLGTSPYLKQNEPPPPPNDLQKELMSLTNRGPGDRHSEDCLVLNVWTPSLKGRRPVMVWLHGGGFAVGSGASLTYDGTPLTRHDVVVVTINHRLNAFGHLYLGQIGGEEFSRSGNVGMLDVVAALKWVNRNIAAFGGDPGNVTIFGESGGAGKVSVICAMPAAKGLFHKAIMQSGPCLTIANKDRGTAIARQLLKDLGLRPDELHKLQTMDADAFGKAASAAETKVVPRVIGQGPQGLIPLVDGVEITHNPFDGVAAPESAAVPFLVGSTKDEGTLFAGPLPGWGSFTEADVLKIMEPIAGPHAAAALALYKQLHPKDTPSYLLSDLITDSWMRQAANTVAELKLRQGKAPAFVYVLDWEAGPLVRAPHGSDVPLVFGTLDAAPGIKKRPGAAEVSRQMCAAWAAFAHNGNPATPELPHWPAYDLGKRPNMVFDVKSHVVNDYGSAARHFWEGAWNIPH